eukprot:Hpha_TRINITY_DN16249_c0_g1::TRINITY_DN16249_c0_g1_i1::g.12633::m.12633
MTCRVTDASKLSFHILHTTDEVSWQSGADLLGVGEFEGSHFLQEFGLALRQARVRRLLVPHRCLDPPLVVVAGVDFRIVRQREDVLVHTVVQGSATALLEVSPPTPLDQYRVPGEAQSRAHLRADHKARATVRVPRCRQHFKRVCPKLERFPRRELNISLRPRHTRDHAAQPGDLPLQHPAPGDVVRVHVCVNSEHQLHPQLPRHPHVPFHLLQHRVYQEALAGALVGKQVGVGVAAKPPIQHLTKHEVRVGNRRLGEVAFDYFDERGHIGAREVEPAALLFHRVLGPATLTPKLERGNHRRTFCGPALDHRRPRRSVQRRGEVQGVLKGLLHNIPDLELEVHPLCPGVCRRPPGLGLVAGDKHERLDLFFLQLLDRHPSRACRVHLVTDELHCD